MVIINSTWQGMAHHESTDSLEQSIPFEYSSLASLISAANSVVGWWHQRKVLDPNKPYFGFSTKYGSQLGWEGIYDVYSDDNLEDSNEQLDGDLDNFNGNLKNLQDSLQNVISQVHPDLLQDQLECDHYHDSRHVDKGSITDQDEPCMCSSSVSMELSSFSRQGSKRISLSKWQTTSKQHSVPPSVPPSVTEQLLLAEKYRFRYLPDPSWYEHLLVSMKNRMYILSALIQHLPCVHDQVITLCS
jgi:hypothetical protein